MAFSTLLICQIEKDVLRDSAKPVEERPLALPVKTIQRPQSLEEGFLDYVVDFNTLSKLVP